MFRYSLSTLSMQFQVEHLLALCSQIWFPPFLCLSLDVFLSQRNYDVTQNLWELICLLSVGIFNHVIFICINCFTFSFIGPEKPRGRGSGQLRYLYIYYQDPYANKRTNKREEEMRECFGHRDLHYS